MLELVLTAAFTAAVLRLSAPLLLAALGGLCSERAGVVNIALEGLMTCGACAAALAAAQWGNPWIGLAVGAGSGMLLAGLHALATVTFRMDHLVSGTAINVLALGVPGMVIRGLRPGGASMVQVPEPYTPWAVPGLSRVPWVGEALFQHTPMVYITVLAAGALAFALYRTPWGLRLRAAGEAPGALDRAGVSVTRIRYSGVLLSGVAAGAAGSMLVLALGSHYVRDITAGRGFMALAALVFGRWHPAGVVGACLLFGAAQAFQMRLQGFDLVPAQWVQLLPYVLTLLILVIRPKGAAAPAALGQPYARESGSEAP